MVGLAIVDQKRLTCTFSLIGAQSLAQHFIAGPPSDTAVATLRDNFLETQGNLKQLALTLIGLDEVWQQDGWIFKRPDEYLVSVGRAFPEWEDYFEADFTKQMGQEYMNAPGPDGWPQTGEDWITAESLLVRLSWLRPALKSLPNWINPDYFSLIIQFHYPSIVFWTTNCINLNNLSIDLPIFIQERT